MNFPKPVMLSEIADLIGAKIKGDRSALATGINEIHRVRHGDLVFVDHPKYYRKCIESDASFIIINQDTQIPEGKALLIVDEPFEAYQKIVSHYRPFIPLHQQICETAIVGADSVIMTGAVVGAHVRIGSHCIIYPNAVIMDHCIIGDNVIIQSGTVIGSDAFYYNKKTDREVHYRKMLSGGRVVIEDDVEIGANCTIDRGVSADTVIGKGTKIDNLVHIGHDVLVGKNCLMASQVGIAGATVIEDNVILWGQVGVNKTITIEKGVEVMGQSGVTASLKAGKRYMGYPAEEALTKSREMVWIKRIPEIWEKVMQKKKEE